MADRTKFWSRPATAIPWQMEELVECWHDGPNERISERGYLLFNPNRRQRWIAIVLALYDDEVATIQCFRRLADARKWAFSFLRERDKLIKQQVRNKTGRFAPRSARKIAEEFGLTPQSERFQEESVAQETGL